MEFNRKTNPQQFEPVWSGVVVGHKGEAITRQEIFVVCQPQSILVRCAPGLFEMARDHLHLLDQLAEVEREGGIQADLFFGEERARIREVVEAIDEALAFDPRDEPGGLEVREQIATMLERRSAEVRAMADRQEDRDSNEILNLEANTLRDAAKAARAGKWPEVGR